MLKFKKKLKKEQTQQNQQSQLNNDTEEVIELETKKEKKKVSKKAIKAIVGSSVLVLAHVVILLAIILSFRYYSIYPALFCSLVGIVLCLMVIIDIVYFVGFNHKDRAMKIISISLASLLFLGGTIGTAYIAKINGTLNSVLGNGKESSYEKFSGTFVSYDKFNKFTSISELSGKRIGMLAETSNGLKYIATNLLDKEKFDYAEIDYKSNAELVQALIDGDIDAMVITSAYRSIYENDENSSFGKYLDNFVDFYPFEEELKVTTNKVKKDLSKEPFNVLLIGWSRTDIGSTVGLADSIILATVNPQTYTVSMMSIARDSFVPIACYGGEYDKINSGRSTSRACFIETVENFIGMDIDYYMELDYLGLVQIVNVIGGVKITNPVDFELDGIYVPAGTYYADGQQALQFCRERHHMPNGDFDRQQHQKEVIMGIAKQFIKQADINLALDALEAASEWMSTDLTVNELTQMFNLLLNTKNYTGMDTFSLVDFQTLRITGYGGIMYYSYDMRLPLWVYLIYQGSYDESMKHVNDVMGNYSSMNQDKSFEFSCQDPYVRAPFFSLDYEDKYMFTPDPMPEYLIDFTGKDLGEAIEWCNAHNVKITGYEYILPGDEGYDSEKEGLIVDQSGRYGSLLAEVNETTLTIMGTGEVDESKQVPLFVGHSYQKAIDWADEYGIDISIDFDNDVDGDIGKVVSQDPKAFTSIDDVEKLRIVVKSGIFKIKFNTKYGTAPDSIEVETGDSTQYFEDLESIEKDGNIYVFKGWYTSEGSSGTKVTKSTEVSAKDGESVTVYAKWTVLYTVTFNENYEGGYVDEYETSDEFPSKPSRVGYKFDGWYTDKTGGSKVESFDSITKSCILYAHWKECTHTWDDGKVTTSPTCTEKGIKKYTCKDCGQTKEEEVAALGHDYQDVAEVPATCEEDGTTAGKKCSRCEDSNCETITALGHDYGEWSIVKEATETEDGKKQRACSRCDSVEEETIHFE